MQKIKQVFIALSLRKTIRSISKQVVDYIVDVTGRWKAGIKHIDRMLSKRCKENRNGCKRKKSI